MMAVLSNPSEETTWWHGGSCISAGLGPGSASSPSRRSKNEILKGCRPAGLLVGRNGQGTMESVHDHLRYMLHAGTGSGVCRHSGQGRVRLPGGVPRAASAGPGGRKRSRWGRRQRAPSRGMQWCFGGEDRIMRPNDAVEGRGVLRPRGVGAGRGARGTAGCIA